MQRIATVVVCAAVMVVGAAAARADVVIRVGCIAPDGSRYMRDIMGMTRDIERVTDGAVKLKWYSGGALGDDLATVKLLEAGKIDGGGFTDAGLAALVPEMRAWGFPAMFDSSDEIDYMQRRMRQRYDELFERQGYILMFWGDIGFQHVFSKHKIANLADLRQRRLWLWADDPSAIYFAGQVGIQVRTTSLGQLVGEITSGRIDTWQFPPLAAIAFGNSRHAKYVSELRWRYMIGAVVIRKDVWDRMTPAEQRAVRAIAAKWERRVTTGWRVEEKKTFEVMRRSGTQVVKVEAAAREEFYLEAVRHRQAYAKRFGIEAIIGEFVDSLRQYRELHR